MQRLRNPALLAALFAALLLGLTSCASTKSIEKKLTPAQLARIKIYKKALEEAKYAPQLDEKGSLVFTVDGGTYHLLVNADDPELLQLQRQNLWQIRTTREKARVVDAASFANRRSKVAKVYVSGLAEDNITASLDLILPKPEDFEALLTRMIRMVDNAKTNFESQM